MIASPAETLDDVLALIRGAVTERNDWADTAARVRATLEGHLAAAQCLPAPVAGPAVDTLTTRALHSEPDGSFSVVALAIPPGAATVIHDHVTWCVFALLAGAPVEDRFVLDQSGGALMSAGEQPCPIGTLTGGAPPGDIHRLSNTDAHTAVSLHVYGTDVSRIGSSIRRTYDLPIIPSTRADPE